MINVQAGIGYWFFTNKAWANHIAGVMALENGFEVIPVDFVGYAKKAKVCFSVGLSLDYLLGLSKKNSLHSYLNTVSANLFTNAYFKVHDLHSIYLNFGILYAIDILRYKDMYAESKINTFNGFGISFGVGYKYMFKEKLGVILGIAEEFVFYSKTMSKFRGKLGFDFLVYSKEHLR